MQSLSYKLGTYLDLSDAEKSMTTHRAWIESAGLGARRKNKQPALKSRKLELEEFDAEATTIPPLPNSTGGRHVQFLDLIKANGVDICETYYNNITSIASLHHNIIKQRHSNSGSETKTTTSFSNKRKLSQTDREKHEIALLVCKHTKFTNES